ncbi:hypothetical protein [Halosimplex salinum]|uniref:hypothetical protein n=1 Tax=Halosimplex salinum TaxID=1710538 RepID=UPI000F478123|nr:hypothetical protein [Halosimplex salinum]
MDRLATLRGSTDDLRRLVRETSLTADVRDPFYRVVRLSVSAGGLEATTPTGGHGPTFHARYDAAAFDSLSAPDEPFLAALGTEATLRWLDWFEDGTVTATFRGDAEQRVARAIELENGDDCVEVGPLPSDTVDPDLSTGRPECFEDRAFVHDGAPAPTRVETTGETLERLVEATDIVGSESVPVVVADEQFRLAVVGDTMRGRGALPATVSGPDCENRYGEGLAAIARVCSGPVTLQVVPGGPLAVVQDEADARKRYVLTQSM